MRTWLLSVAILAACLWAGGGAPASAQARPSSTPAQDADAQPPPVSPANQVGQVAESSVGQAGQRETRDSAASVAGIKPDARVESRIQNRVQNRIYNRIDRNYGPQASAANPFAVAQDETRAAGRPR